MSWWRALLVAAVLVACTDAGEEDAVDRSPDRFRAVVHLGVAFEVPREVPVREDYLAYACRRHEEPGVFLGEGTGFCPFSDEPPAKPAVYVGPFYQVGREQGDLVRPVPLPDDVGRPAGMTEEQVDGVARWVDEESTVFPELNVRFDFVGVDDEVRLHIEDSVHENR